MIVARITKIFNRPLSASGSSRSSLSASRASSGDLELSRDLSASGSGNRRTLMDNFASRMSANRNHGDSV